MEKKRELISFRAEEVITKWLKSKEAETGKPTPDFLREIMWAYYHQDKRQKLDQSIAKEYYDEKYKSLVKGINEFYSFLSIPENRALLANYLLQAIAALKPLETGLEQIIGGARKIKRVPRERRKPKNHKPRVRRKDTKSLEKPHD